MKNLSQKNYKISIDRYFGRKKFGQHGHTTTDKTIGKKECQVIMQIIDEK